MRITIEGARVTPTWVTLQELLRETLKCPKGHLARIARKDRGVDYRSLGEYNVIFTDKTYFEGYEVTLIVK